MQLIRTIFMLGLISTTTSTYAQYISNVLYIDSVVQVVNDGTHMQATVPHNLSKIRDPKVKPNATRQFHRHAWKYRGSFCTDQVKHLFVYGHMETKQPHRTKKKVSYSDMKGYYIKCPDIGGVAESDLTIESKSKAKGT
jgi:hypothetical protein